MRGGGTAEDYLSANAPIGCRIRKTSAMRPGPLALVAALLLTTLAAPARATTVRHWPDVLRPAATNQFPEGVAWDPSRRALLVGSLTPARITAVAADATTTTVVTDPELPAFLGLEVDRAHQRIVAVHGAPGLPGGLAAYDLRTGARAWSVPLPGAPNDVAVDPRGTAYVTDTTGSVYRVDRAGRVSTVVTDPRLGPELGVNGIAWHPDGYLLLATFVTGRLFRLQPGGELRELTLRTPLTGADGIALRRDGTLVVVTNALAPVPGASAAVHELVLRRDSALAYRVTPWADPAPTTVAATPHGDYVLDGHLDVLLGGGTSTDFVLRRR